MSKQDSLKQQDIILNKIISILDKNTGYDSRIDNINKQLKNVN